MKNKQFNFSTFKRDINLVEYAAKLGYKIDRKKSTRHSIAMRSSSDKVIISRKGSIWVYFSVSDDSDKGTIIDFVQHRTKQTIVEVGKALAIWSGDTTRSVSIQYQVREQTYDTRRVQQVFQRCQAVLQHDYLESRGLSSKLLGASRFTNRIFKDRFGNAAFPHYSANGVCGLELKNADRGLLVRGSRKTFWRSNSQTSDTTLVITEAVIDALSYHQLFKNQSSLYLATGGGVSADQCLLLTKLISSVNTIQSIVLATDNDDGGERIAERLRKAIAASSFKGETVVHSPDERRRDWNDILRQNVELAVPT